MFSTKFMPFNNILKSIPQISANIANTQIIFRLSTNADTLQPVKLSYATYESTTADKPSQAAPLVIMHGLFGSKSNWNSLCKVYQQKCNPQRKVIAVDARNHGDSPHSDEHTYAHLAADLKSLFNQLGVEKAALMGHSMGGRAVMLFALKYPELVDRLIVGDISPIRNSPNLDSMPSLFQAMESVNLPNNVPMSQARTMVDEQLAKYMSDKSLRAFLITNLVATDNGSYTWRINIPALMANFNNIARFPMVNDVHYDGPVLFIAGSSSDFVQYNSLPAKYIMPVENLDLAYASYQSTKSFTEADPEPTPVVILHDFMSSKNNWNSFCKKCHEMSKCRVVAVDARNHGDSPHTKNHSYDNLVLDIRQFLHKMGMKRCSLLGHAMGGRTAMLFALKYKLDIPETLSLSQARKVAAEKLTGFMKDINAVMFLVTNLVQRSEGSYGWRFNINALLNNFEYISAFPIIHNITYDGPVLFVGGEKSDFIQKSDYPKIRKLFPNAELTYIEGAGHWLHSEKPTEFLKITLDFLNKK
nr:unnamed protein product [Callosobruchus chinensis]